MIVDRDPGDETDAALTFGELMRVARDPGDETDAALTFGELMRVASMLAAREWGLATSDNLADYQPARKVTRDTSATVGVYFTVWVGNRAWAVVPRRDEDRAVLERAWRQAL